MRTALFLTVVLLVLLHAVPSPAMTGREFMGLPTARERLAVAEKQREFFAANGYRNIPDVYDLTARMESLVLDGDWNDKWLDWISLTAAKQLGMHP